MKCQLTVGLCMRSISCQSQKSRAVSSIFSLIEVEGKYFTYTVIGTDIFFPSLHFQGIGLLDSMVDKIN